MASAPRVAAEAKAPAALRLRLYVDRAERRAHLLDADGGFIGRRRCGGVDDAGEPGSEYSGTSGSSDMSDDEDAMDVQEEPMGDGSALFDDEVDVCGTCGAGWWEFAPRQ
jgi:hypothetical protein